MAAKVVDQKQKLRVPDLIDHFDCGETTLCEDWARLGVARRRKKMKWRILIQSADDANEALRKNQWTMFVPSSWEERGGRRLLSEVEVAFGLDTCRWTTGRGWDWTARRCAASGGLEESKSAVKIAWGVSVLRWMS